MSEKPGGLQIKGSGIRDGRSCSLQTALHPPVVEAAEPDDSEYIGELGYPGFPRTETPLIREQLLSTETPLIVEQLFTDL